MSACVVCSIAHICLSRRLTYFEKSNGTTEPPYGLVQKGKRPIFVSIFKHEFAYFCAVYVEICHKCMLSLLTAL